MHTTANHPTTNAKLNQALRATSLLILSSVACADVLVSDFDNGTTQGWSALSPFGGTLSVITSGGNPGGYLRATDTVEGGGNLAALAPMPLFGNLTELDYLKWDVLLPSSPTLSTGVYVQGVNGTVFRSTNTINASTPSGVWFTKTASFTSSAGWTRISGRGSFESVMTNAGALYIDLDAAPRVDIEAGIDNIRTRTSRPVPLSSCPQNSDLTILPEGGGGLCTTALANLPSGYSVGSTINWSWALGGYAGQVTNQPPSATTVPIYHPSGNWSNYYLVVNADIVLANGNRCHVWNQVLLKCGTRPGNQ